MLCKSPYMYAGTIPLSCGGCLPCRIKQTSLWKNRQILESYTHDENAFVTLTYSEEELPKDGSVSPTTLKLFLKRLRKALSPRKIRFYAVGEYGEKSLRPHYHLSLFGASISDELIVQKAWGFGHTLTAEFNAATAAYVCGYITHKWKNKIDPDPRLGTLHPEFNRQSNRPGIGGPAMAVISDAIHTPGGLNELERVGDVPRYLQIGKRKISLGRYLVQKLREEVGMPDDQIKAIKQTFLMETGYEMLRLFENKVKAGEAISLQNAVVQEHHQAVLNQLSRHRIFEGKKSL